ncbi:MAG TPA: biopolymer transporter ExbD [Bacteroidales bacterium]|nr:biopolymer transporter ExbD [Bacteroidales bacterium]HPF03240.1 biopolymer transporter ExbD [Bacteroidales bacterium]HPJ59526.1 biopolymer transporter ExbD [Bacteroidales bacterium]HPR12063.1 biopolymer transporter ExbD [Bacteroidales bacterium]HRW86686.1 biopolymer transporter ExbD [Bacteroidales bacterium]
MAEIIVEEKGEGGKKKAKKHPPHIDMTPMVDLMCLLIVFFMLTTAFSKAKIMEIILPEKVKDPTQQEAPKIVASRTLNILLGPDDRLFWYPGAVKEEDFNNLPPLMETDFSADGIRKLLLERNRTLARTITEFRDEVISGRINISQDSLQSSISQLKKDDDTGPIVLIKAYKEADYGNFVDILDEMNICGIARYTFMKIAWYEEKMVETAIGTPALASSSN